jgi:hypothetical protein
MEISTSQPQNIYTVLSDLQNNHRRYLQLMEDAVEMLREQRPTRGGFRGSLEQYRGTTTAATTTGTTGIPTAPTTGQNDVLSFEFVSYANAASILAALSGQGSNGTAVDVSNNTTVYQQPELPEQATCPITLEPIEVGTSVMKITRCGHVFKEAPLRRWLSRDGRCPVCRGAV